MIRKRYTVADFFAGCGGLSHGFDLTKRFNVVFGSDLKDEALKTFVLNHESELGPPEAVLDDIKNLSPRTIKSILRKFKVEKDGGLDCLIGGPPCEGFSQNRSINSGGQVVEGTATRTNRFLDDPRNQLFRWFVELADYLKPRVVVIENVPDLVRHKDGATLKEVLTALDRAGYIATVRVLNAADYGVPQMRRRAIFLAQRKSDFLRSGIKLKFPEPTHRPFPLQNTHLEEDKEWLPGDVGYWTTVREAIDDLPPASCGQASSAVNAVYSPALTSALRCYYRNTDGEIFHHIARPLGRAGLQKVLSITKGQAAADIPDHLRPKASYHYSYARLRWSEPARTITKFCYHVGSGMFTHPLENRAVTMREAARLQTFPDAFRFMSDNIRDLSAMIGSAVPPLLAKHLATGIAHYLDELQAIDLSPADRILVRPQATDAVMKRLQREEWDNEDVKNSQASLFMIEE